MRKPASANAMIAILAEKPSVARDIARVVGAVREGEGCLVGNGYIVTWAVGHLVRLAQPHEIRPEWRTWRADLLPMLPQQWPLIVAEETREQFEVVRKILLSPEVSSVICATDAGREGELIFRQIYEAAACRKPVRRLWISSLTPEAIRKGLESMKPASSYDSLADAARGRSRADWLVGLNLSRAYTLALGDEISVGRVQTPTLAMVVARELEIRAFVPEPYIEVVATFSPGEPGGGVYRGVWFRQGVEPIQMAMRLDAEGKEAAEIVARARTGEARILSLRREIQRMPPPLLYDLTELQRHANRLFGFSAQKTLDLAQTLYERHKLISYPRTDSRHLSLDVARTLPRIVAAVRAPYESLLAPETGEKPLSRRFVDDAKVTDHHAIIPTPTPPGNAKLNSDERRLYDLICRRLLSAWHEDHIWAVTTVTTAVHNPGVADLYHSMGSAVLQPGWKILDVAPTTRKKGANEDQMDTPSLPSSLEEGQRQDVLDAKVVKKKTSPPKRFTEATLLTAMETAGKTLDDKALSEAMRDCGLGTPATRAAIIETLLKRQFIRREGKGLVATEKGIRLIEAVHPEVKSPAMTGQWEARLDRIHRRGEPLQPFLQAIEDYVREVVQKVLGGALQTASESPRAPAPCPGSDARCLPAAKPTDRLNLLLRERFGFESFRPSQEEVCRAVLEGNDVLLVMPTGSGKSLCYQLPGIALGGTTLVISPLIALMEDQVAKLRALGFRADRIHSGRDRAASRQTCIEYLHGALDFLYIAPERLRVPGFPEMLAKRKPSLIAIDEAHCISQWGHDFRPDYRMIGQHLPALRPAPVLALTATATPLVQRDIAEQLGLKEPARFIQGFRRENIAIEVVEAAVSRRGELVRRLLQDPGRRPAIVYTPTRRECETLAETLRRDFPAAAYHAGLEPSVRDQVQSRFLEGSVEVIVATIAFGMGIDKPNIRTVIHTALPGSLEGYYQEIGRAGRDGLPSRAILMQSYSDRRTHDFFFNRNYPDSEVLARIFQCLDDEPKPKQIVAPASRLDPEVFDTALEKLWIHGGVEMDFAENVSRGCADWRASYEAQRDQKRAQLEQMIRYAECNQCRMVALVRHFGDFSDARTRCGICDFCAPEQSMAHSFRPAQRAETEVARRCLQELRGAGSLSAGSLHGKLAAAASLDRRTLERVLAGLARAGWVELVDDSFLKDGRRIDFKRVRLTALGRTLAPEAELAFNVTEPVEALPKSPKRAPRRRRAAETAPSPPSKKETKGPSQDRILEALRAWRLTEARRQGVPAFRILSDRTLHALAAEMPATAAELLAIPGIGLRSVEKYGAAIFRILHERR